MALHVRKRVYNETRLGMFSSSIGYVSKASLFDDKSVPATGFSKAIKSQAVKFNEPIGL